MRGAPAERYRSTVVATRTLLDAMAATTTVRRLVLISSIAVYGTHDLPTGAVVDEHTPVESDPAARGAYVVAKLDQENLVRAWAAERDVELVVLRPGVVYGPGADLSERVALRVGPLLVAVNPAATVPLTYVDNCADAVVRAADVALACPPTVTVIDGDLLTAREYLRRRRRALGWAPTVAVPYAAAHGLGRGMAWYDRHTHGQIPAFLTEYGVRCRHRPFRWPNAALVGLGWQQRVPTAEGLRRTFAAGREVA
jgi:nucleoside-diphosphate-sugar epimerase